VATRVSQPRHRRDAHSKRAKRKASPGLSESAGLRGSRRSKATCKSLFEVRMKRCGARWKEATGQHIVQLRALALSDRWGPAIELTLRPLRKAVRAS